MLMKYAAVTLLLAVLTSSAVLAQSPPQKRSPSPQPKGPARVLELPVKPLPAALVRLSVKAIWPAESSSIWITATVENISGRDIHSVFIPAAGREEAKQGWLHSKPLQPGEVYVTKPVGPFSSSWFPLLTYEVVSIVFEDGSTWCANVCPLMAELRAGWLVGRRTAALRLQTVLAEGGFDALIKAVGEKFPEDDPAALMKAGRKKLVPDQTDPAAAVDIGELVNMVPPPGHTPYWEYGFYSGRNSVAYTFKHYVWYGTEPMESRIKSAFQAVGMK